MKIQFICRNQGHPRCNTLGSIKAHFHALSAMQSLIVEGRLGHNWQTSMSLWDPLWFKFSCFVRLFVCSVVPSDCAITFARRCVKKLFGLFIVHPRTICSEFFLSPIWWCLYVCLVAYVSSDAANFPAVNSHVAKCQTDSVLICVLCVYSCPRERGVWLGLSDVDSPGKLRWVNGSGAHEGEEGLPPRSPISRGNLCVSLDQRGQTSSHPCNAKRAYVCQYSPQGKHHTQTHTDTCKYGATNP